MTKRFAILRMRIPRKVQVCLLDYQAAVYS